MTIARRITRPCVLHRTTTSDNRDDMGDPADGLPATSATFCEIQEVYARELRDGRMVLTSTWRVFLRPTENVTGLDTITVDGEVYSFQGHPWRVRHPRRGTILHIEANAQKVT